MHLRLSSPRLPLGLILACLASTGFFSSDAMAKSPLNLDVLARDGYGVVQMSRPQSNVLLVHATVNGRSVKLILDTGFEADGLALDSNLSNLGVTTHAGGTGVTITGKRVPASKGIAESVVMGNVHITGAPVTFGTFLGLQTDPLSNSVETRVHESVDANGFVTSGFLRTNSAIIDLHNLRLYLRPPGTGRRVVLGPALKSAGLSEVSFSQTGHGECFVDVEVNGVAGKMVMDTGAFLTGVDARFASQVKAHAYDRNLEMIDVAGVKKAADLTNTRSFKIGGIAIPPPVLAVHTFSFYSATGGKLIGCLGMDILGQNWGIIDFGQQKLYFAAAR